MGLGVYLQYNNVIIIIIIIMGDRGSTVLRRCATNQVDGSVPDDIIGIFPWT